MKNFRLKNFNPSVKLIINLIFLLAALFSSSLYTSLMLLSFLVLTAVCFRQFKLKHIYILMPFCLFAFSLIWMNGLWGKSPQGDEILRLLVFEFSRPGLYIGVLLAMRVIIIILAGLLFTMSSPSQDLILSLMQQLALPPGFAYAVLAAMNLISEIKRDRLCLITSYRMKKSKGLSTFRSIIPLLAINIRRCESISLAMEARGFAMNAKRSYYRKILWRKRDSFLLLMNLISILSIFLISYQNDFAIGYARWNGYQ